MECSKIKLKLDEYMKGRMDPLDMEKVRLHLLECRSCSEEVIILRGVNEILDVEVERCPPHDFADNIMNMVEMERVRSRVNFFKRAPVLNLGASLILTGIFLLFANVPLISQTVNKCTSGIKEGASTISTNITAATSELRSYFTNIIEPGGDTK